MSARQLALLVEAWRFGVWYGRTFHPPRAVRRCLTALRDELTS